MEYHLPPWGLLSVNCKVVHCRVWGGGQDYCVGSDLNVTSGAAVQTVEQRTRGIPRTSSVSGVSTMTQFGTSISGAGNTTEFGYFAHLHCPGF